MNTATDIDRLAALVKDVQTRKKLNPPVAKPTWREIAGTSPGDEIDQEAARYGEEWRKSEGAND